MRRGLILALSAALATHAAAAPPGPDLTLELRAFNGREEVTAHTRLTVHRAGERGEPLINATSPDGRVQVRVPAGIYDVQAIHERDGRVLNIRWANRLVVMPYPDEPGQHLEVINFKAGFGALQIRSIGTLPDLLLFDTGKRDKPAAVPVIGSSYVLFVVPAGSADLLIRAGAKSSWQPRLEVPLDRTRLWVVPQGQ